MPTLPSITVTDAQLARITAAFPGATNVEKVAAYRDWLKAELREQVTRTELAALADQQNAARRAIADDVAANAI